MRKSPGQGSNPRHSSNLGHSYSNTGSLTHCATWEFSALEFKCISLIALWEGGWIRKGGKQVTIYEEAAGDSGRNHVTVAAELGDMRDYRQVSEM